MNKKETLEVEVSDSVSLADSPGESPESQLVTEAVVEPEVPPILEENEESPAPEPTEEEVAKRREEILQKVTERKVELAEKYVKPHNKPGRVVTEADLTRVIKDAEVMSEMCLVGRGDYSLAPAIAHTQIESEDPLRFYVRNHPDRGQTEIIVNPVITSTTGGFTGQKEGCLSYPEEPMKDTFRYSHIKMRYQTIATRGEGEEQTYSLTPEVTNNIGGVEARICQHELSHLNGSNIYDEGYSALSCEGLRTIDN